MTNENKMSPQTQVDNIQRLGVYESGSIGLQIEMSSSRFSKINEQQMVLCEVE